MVYDRFILNFNRRNPKIKLAVFADLHDGDKHFDRKKFRAWRDKHKTDKYTWFIGNGDLIEALTPFDPRFTLDHIDPRHLGRQAIIRAQIDDVCEELEPMKPRLLGVGMGNHEWEILRRTGFDPTDEIARQLDIANLGFSCLLSLVLRAEDRSGGSRVIKYYQHHGWGGGCRTKGGDITKASKKPTEVVSDIFVFSHSHQNWDLPASRIDVTTQGKAMARDYLLVNTGTFKRGLSEGTIPTYEERMGFGPQKLGGKIIEIEVDTMKWVKMKAY